jgi:RHS repeat-associated protein
VTYDAENRIATAPGLQYSYDARNKRIWSWAGGTDPSGWGNASGYNIFVYSPSGQRLGTYQITVYNNGISDTNLTLQSTLITSDLFFGGRRLAVQDRLGSVGSYFPYGEARTGTNPLDTWSFATYWRDSATSLDYADQRYYSNQFGRFMTADRYHSSSGPQQPQSWNRYAYVQGDPINANDPHGMDLCIDCFFGDDPDSGSDGDPGCWGGDPFSPAPPDPFCGQGPFDTPRQPQKPLLYATFLLVTGDCYYTSPLTGNEIRRRTYEVLDQNYQPMGNGIDILENIGNVTPAGNSITGNGEWTTGRQSGEPPSSFQDFYSNGANTSTTNALQNFFAIVGGSDLPLTVLEPSNFSGNPATYSSYGTQGVFYSPTGVIIDGYYYNPIVGTGQAGKPCDPPTPGLP